MNDNDLLDDLDANDQVKKPPYILLTVFAALGILSLIARANRIPGGIFFTFVFFPIFSGLSISAMIKLNHPFNLSCGLLGVLVLALLVLGFLFEWPFYIHRNAAMVALSAAAIAFAINYFRKRR